MPIYDASGVEQVTPTVSVIIPAYNAASTIGSCIESVLAQSYPPEAYEVIVVDNDSTDATAEIAGQYPVTVVFENARRSPGAARNRGIQAAQGEILVFIDADCVAQPGWLAKLVNAFDETRVGVAGGRISSVCTQTDLIARFLCTNMCVTASVYRASEPLGFPTGNVAYRKSALSLVGVFDSAMPWGEDIDLAWRVQQLGRVIGRYVDDAVVRHSHKSGVVQLYKQYRKYGTAEIVLSTLYRGQPFHRRTPGYQLRGMLSQLRALITYPLSFLVRLCRWRRWRTDRLYLVSPLLWFVVDLGFLCGKIEGLWLTRLFRRNPYPTNTGEVKRRLEELNAPDLGAT